MTLRSKNCQECGAEYLADSKARSPYCDLCKPKVKRNQAKFRKRKQRDSEDWLKEPVTLQEKIAALQDFHDMPWRPDYTPHPDRYFTGDDYYIHDYEEICDLLEELKNEEH